MKRTLGILIMLMISSCTSMPTKDELEGADYGIPPKDNKVGEVYEQIIRGTLIDPSSIQTRNIQQPQKFWTKNGKRLSAFWLICGEVNAKNRFGGYTGFKPEMVWFKTGQGGVLQSIPGNPGCVLAPAKKEIDPCGYYRGQNDLFKCK